MSWASDREWSEKDDQTEMDVHSNSAHTTSHIEFYVDPGWLPSFITLVSSSPPSPYLLLAISSYYHTYYNTSLVPRPRQVTSAHHSNNKHGVVILEPCTQAFEKLQRLMYSAKHLCIDHLPLASSWSVRLLSIL